MTRFAYILFHVLMLSVIIYTGVDAFYRVVRAELTLVKADWVLPEASPETAGFVLPPSDDYRVIQERNLFGSVEGVRKGPGAQMEEAQIEGLAPTSLKLALLGTVAGDPRTAVAVIEETDKRKQGIFRVGDTIQGAEVKGILRGKVVLRVKDRDEILTMEESSSSRRGEEEGTRGAGRPVRPGTETTVTVSRSLMEDALKNVNTLLSQVRIRPHFKDGQADGLAIHRIQSDSIFSKLGFRNGDVVQGINDRPIRSPADIVALYKNLESGSPVSLKINRRGRPTTLHYRFE